MVYPSAAFDVLDLASKTNDGGVALPDGNFAWGAVSPDGTLAYLTGWDGGGEVLPIDLTTDPPTLKPTISVPNAVGVAFSPDGKTAWVAAGTGGASATGVIPIDVATGTKGSLIATGTGAYGVAVSPNGNTVWVANHDDQTVTEINAATKTAVKTVDVSPGHPLYPAVSPDGSRVFVSLQTEHKLAWINAGDGSFGGSVDTGGVEARGVAVSPDGRTVFVTDGTLNGSGQGNQVRPVDVTASTPTVKDAITGFVDPVWDAITPDQAPVAEFTVQSAPPGSATSFDASSSQAPSTPIVSYAWTFGDGSTQTTSTPTVSHVYQHAGSYEASVTETDAAGTSTAPVYTGQQLLRAGGPGASTTKSVIVTTGAGPSVTVQPSSLDFGTLALHKSSDAQEATVTNAGTASLHISRADVGGVNGGDFTLDADGCTGANVAPGAHCTVRVVFTPSAGGPRSGQLRFTDNASGSPHVVALGGTGVSRAVISGRVTGDAGQPVQGAEVSVCTYSSRAICKSDTTDRDGAYQVSGLPADRYQVEVHPGGGNLFPASSVLELPVGATVQDFRLSAPRPLAPGLTFNGSSSGVAGGFWKNPAVVTAPLHALSEAPAPGAYGFTVAYFDADSNTGNGSQLATQAITVIYRFDSASVPRFVALNQGTPFTEAPSDGRAGALGSWRLGLTQTPSPGTDVRTISMQGLLTPPANGPYFHGGAAYSVSQVEFGAMPATPARDARSAQFACKRTKLGTKPIPNGPYDLPHGRWNADGTFTPKVGPLKGHTLIPTGRTATDQYGHSDLSVYYDPKTNTYWFTDGDTGDIHQATKPSGYSPPASTSTTATYGGYPSTSGQYSAPNQGSPATAVTITYTDAQGVTHTVTSGPSQAVDHPARDAGRRRAVAAKDGWICPDPAQDPGGSNDSFSGYVDPSGLVLTTRGVPVAGARVVLLRSGAGRGHLRPVRNGSTVMSPSNRRNPDRTDAAGHFGWDVLTGFYRVTASHPGCRAAHGGRAAQTTTFPVPPPVDDLRLVLSCPHLRRLATRMSLQAKLVPAAYLILTAKVAGPPGKIRRAGIVQFTIGRRRLAVPLLRRDGVVTATIRRPARGTRVVATYLGNGVFAPSRGGARTP